MEVCGSSYLHHWRSFGADVGFPPLCFLSLSELFTWNSNLPDVSHLVFFSREENGEISDVAREVGYPDQHSKSNPLPEHRDPSRVLQ